MKVTPLGIEGAWMIEAQTHKDNRGLFREWFRSDTSENSLLPDFKVIQANTSVSEKGVIRGIHYSDEKSGQSKIVTCTHGSILDSIVDLRAYSKTFGNSVTIELNSENGISVYISAGLGHGFQALENKTAITYLLNKKYDASAEYAINPLDDDLGIEWRKIPVVISEKDSLAPSFNSLKMARNV